MLPIATDVLELEITPNRPDCLSVYGVAREVHAATDTPLAPPPWATDEHPAGDAIPGFSVEVQAPDLCPRFTARLFEDVTLGPSPYWLKARLMAAGQRPINNVVDITNYVMLLTGQPMHAFDADLVAGGRLVVRRARDGETMTTLDDVERTLDGEMCVIDDAEGPTSIAGVMGGARSEVRDTTTRVLMEAATWNGPNIQRTSTRLALRTEASGRFEKQLQPEQGIDGQAVATQLMIELCGARPVGGTIDVGGPGPDPVTLRLRDARTERLLGAPVPRADAARILTGLGFGVAEAARRARRDRARVAPRRRRARGRPDRGGRADLGPRPAPVTLPSRRGAVGRLAPAQRLRRRAEDALRRRRALRGRRLELHRARDRAEARPAGRRRGRAREPDVRGAGGDAHDAARLAARLAAAQRVARDGGRPALRGRRRLLRRRGHRPDRQPLVPRARSCAARRGHARRRAATGRLRAPSWSEPEPPRADFFAAKGVLEALMHALRIPFEVRRSDEDPFLHPGRAARVIVRRGEEELAAGWLGELHPAVAARWDLAAPSRASSSTSACSSRSRRPSRATRT